MIGRKTLLTIFNSERDSKSIHRWKRIYALSHGGNSFSTSTSWSESWKRLQSKSYESKTSVLLQGNPERCQTTATTCNNNDPDLKACAKKSASKSVLSMTTTILVIGGVWKKETGHVCYGRRDAAYHAESGRVCVGGHFSFTISKLADDSKKRGAGKGRRAKKQTHIRR